MSLPNSLGVLMTFKYDDISLMDFNRFDELMTLVMTRQSKLMDSIKQRISRRANYRQLEMKRMAFKKENASITFSQHENRSTMTNRKNI